MWCRLIRPFQYRDLPDPSASLHDRTQICVFCHLEDPVRVVQVQAEGTSPKSEPHIGENASDMPPPAICGKAQREEPAGVIGRGADQRFHIRVAADHAMEQDDVGLRHIARGPSEIQHPALDPTGEVERFQQLAGRVLVRAHEIDARGANRPRAKKFYPERADSAAYLEHRRVAYSSLDDDIDHPSAGWIEPLL